MSRSPFGEDVRCIGRLIREVCADIPGALAIPGFNLVPRLPEFFSDRHIHPNDTGFGIFAQNLLREITSSWAVGLSFDGKTRQFKGGVAEAVK